MSPKGGRFNDSYDDLLREVSGMSDADLERAMSAAQSPATTPRRLEPGERVDGLVVDVRGGEVLVDLGGKEHGIIDASEFGDGEIPRSGERIRATFEKLDEARGLAVLSVRGLRKQVTWEDLRQGALVEGVVTAVNKGGLTLDVKGLRAFLPASQVERGRVEDLSSYVGRRLLCEVTAFDRNQDNIVLSRRNILEREAEAIREKTIASLSEGQALKGRVVRLTDHGAFVDLGGLDGLIPSAKIRNREEPLSVGQQVQVQIVRIDREKKRVSLDFKQVEADSWGRLITHYAVGDEVTGWVSARTPSGVVLSIEEGINGIIQEESLHLLPEAPRPGAILKAVIKSIDSERRQLVLRPRPGEPEP